ncbi:MAG: hypothetical protein BLITH_1413 [Brockia lithotrophica]|uniref:Uncharacterized protein n=1 Tax=Brockia lithotrophica TaxID=933949 RepID=A0A2T5G3V8_9BACL|nr:MAG: hypothetical protein BLITH_1413 [Brockia lithotrophica]
MQPLHPRGFSVPDSVYYNDAKYIGPAVPDAFETNSAMCTEIAASLCA